MSHAMQMIRDALGHDAIIIASHRAENGKGVVVTASEPAVSIPLRSKRRRHGALTQEPVLERIEVLRFTACPSMSAQAA